MNVDYQIAGRLWRFVSETPLTDSPASAPFRSREGGAPDWCCQIRQRETLPPARGELLSATGERRLYRDGETLRLELLNRKDGQPLFHAAYPLDGGAEVRLWTLAEQYPYTARLEHLWSAVDFPWHLLQQGILTLHSAAVELRGQALLFLAPSGTGKSTQARLWQELRGARQLNGDKSGLLCQGEQVLACGLPFCGTSGICEPFRLPVGALVLLGQGEENRVRRLTGAAAVQALLENCFGHRALAESRRKTLDAAVAVLQRAPLYALSCTPDGRAVEALEKEWRKGL